LNSLTIIKLYNTGDYSIRDLERIWKVSGGQISRIIGAGERTKRVGVVRHNSKLTPRHEQVIRQAPEELQDNIAEVVLNREGNALNVNETRTLVNLANEDSEKRMSIVCIMLVKTFFDTAKKTNIL